MVNESKIIYKSRNGNDSKEFEGVDFLVHTPAEYPEQLEKNLFRSG